MSSEADSRLMKSPDKPGPAERLGKSLVSAFGNFLYASGFFFQVLLETGRFFRRSQTAYRVLVMQILFTGFEALGVISVLSLALGSIIIVQGFATLPQFGQGQLMYTLLVIVITRELGPVLTAFIIVARSGTAIATELATMVVNHEVEAYLSFGINPLGYLVVPRILGVTLSVMLLSIYFNIFGLLGSWFPASLATSLPFAEYVRNLLHVLTLGDILLSVGKSLVFGLIVSVVSCYQGFNVSRSSTEIPQAGIRAVGRSFVLCILADAVLTVLYYRS